MTMVFILQKKSNTVICKSQREIYPECMGEECPFYGTYDYSDGEYCKRAGDIGEYG